jgi:hypothetical protein
MTFDYALSERYCDLASQILITCSSVYCTGILLKSCFAVVQSEEMEIKYCNRALCGVACGMAFVGLGNCLHIAGKIASNVTIE